MKGRLKSPSPNRQPVSLHSTAGRDKTGREKQIPRQYTQTLPHLIISRGPSVLTPCCNFPQFYGFISPSGRYCTRLKFENEGELTC